MRVDVVQIQPIRFGIDFEMASGVVHGGDRVGPDARARRDAVPDGTVLYFCFNDTATTDSYTLSLPDTLPSSPISRPVGCARMET